jgi:hypothetical protein
MTPTVRTGTSSATVTVLPNGEAYLSSGDPWYRLFRALADLYLDGEIDADDLYSDIIGWIGNGPRLDYLQEHYPAAKALEGKIALAMIEPGCPCDPYRETPCECEPLDRRARLRELIGD